MKLKTNFIKPVSGGVAVIGSILWSTSILALIIAMWLLGSVDAMRQQNQELRGRLDQLIQRQQSEMASQNKTVAKEQMADLRARVISLNSLPGAQLQYVSSHLARFERLLPEDAYFLRLHHEQKRGQITLVAESPSIESLTGFLRKLEADPAIQDVLLQKQRQLDSDNNSRLQFEILIRESD